MKIRVLAALCLLLWLALAVMVAAQAQIGDLSGASVTSQGATQPLASWMSNGSFGAMNYGSCIWGTAGGNDAGPCINAAITAAAAAGGGTVVLPAGTYNVATALNINASGVHLVGAGIGAVRDTISPTSYIGFTDLLWTGAAAATMLTIMPSSTSVPSLYSTDVRGIVFDCNSLANICVELAQVSGSTFQFGVSNPRTIGIWMTTTATSDAPGNQGNDLWISSRSTNVSYSPTGILIDGNASWNTSFNRFYSLGAWYYKGDGVVFGNSDNNVIMNLNATANSGATGTPVVFAAPGYTMPNGLTTDTHGPAYTNLILHTGVFVDIQGFGANSVWTQNGGNVGTAALAPVVISTSGTTAAGSATLNFSSTTGIAAGMSVNCGGIANGVPNGVQVVSATGSTVKMNYPALSTVASSQSCTFSYGFDYQAVAGIYTITATGASTYNITAPAGGTNRTGVTVSGGVLNAFELIAPMTGSATAGDSFTVTASTPASNNTFQFIDEANSQPVPLFATGATGTYQQSYNSYQFPGGNNGINITYGITPCGVLQPSATPTNVNIGNCGGAGATGTDSATIAGVGNSASGFGSITLGGHSTNSSGFYTATTGELTVASGVDAFAGGYTTSATGTVGFTMGNQATDRGRYGEECYSAGDFATQGDAQTCINVMRGTGATGSVFRLTSDNGTAGAADCINLPNNSGFQILVDVMAFDHTTVTKNETWSSWAGLLTRGASAAATAVTMAGTPTPLTNGTVTGSAIAATADTTNGCLNISFTPPTSNTDTWNVVARVRTIEVQ